MKRYYFTRSISWFIDLWDDSDNQLVREKLMNYDVLQKCHVNKEYIQIHKSHIVGVKWEPDVSTNTEKSRNFFSKLTWRIK